MSNKRFENSSFKQGREWIMPKPEWEASLTAAKAKAKKEKKLILIDFYNKL
jgi:hypothetical protein